MLINYVRVALRNLLKNKGYSIINILGLAIGLASCLLILLYLFHEWSYDRFHENSDRIYRVVQTFKSDSREDAGASTPFPLAEALQNDYSQSIVKSVRLFNMQTPKLSLGIKEEEKFFKEPHFFFADSTVFDVFSFKLSKGNPETALHNPQSLVISEEQVQKYFGQEDPMGKTLLFEGRVNLTVTGVMEPLPSNSHIAVDFLASFNTLDNFYQSTYDESWFWNPVWTYILLQENTDIAQIEAQLPEFTKRHYHPNIPETERVEMGVQALTDIHLNSNLDQEIQANSDVRYLYIFSMIAGIILIVACVNFMNLATARSVTRAKEVGMRKTLGADRQSLFFQFMGESSMLTFLGFLVAIGIVFVSIPFFNNLLGLSISMEVLNRTEVWFGVVILYLFVSLFAGIYPAIFLSRFEPVKTMRGEVTKSKAAFNFRRLLVVIQFSLSVFLIIGTILVYQQLNFLQNKKMGFDKESVVIIPTELTRTIWYYNDFKNDLLANANIANVTGARSVLGSQKNTYNTYIPEGFAEEQSFPTVFVMYDFIETYNIELLAGRAFSNEYSTDRIQAIMINQKMVEYLGWKTSKDAIGKSFVFNDVTHYVIGVTENFHHTSLQREIEPLIIDMPDKEYGVVSSISNIVVKVTSSQLEATLDQMKELWKKYDTSHPFDFFFHEDKLNEIYASEKAMGNIATFFSLLCIVVACLGLFGLISYMTESRSKEIGIRKSLGASVSDIITMISKDYLVLILISNLIAWPLVYLAVNAWLENFIFRISLRDYLIPAFLITACAVLFISIVTVSYHSVKAALTNPAHTLKSN